VLRGGGWNNKAQNARSANRNNDNPTNTNDNNGFRCAAPVIFLDGQVLCVYGRKASAQREYARPVPGWVTLNQRKTDPALCGSFDEAQGRDNSTIDQTYFAYPMNR